MKRRFFIHITILLAMMLGLCLAVIHGMWFCAIGAGLMVVLTVVQLYRWIVNTHELLESERYVQRRSERALGNAETQLLYYKMLMEKVDTAVMVCTESGHVEWMNEAAKVIIGDACLIPFEVGKGIEQDDELVKFSGKEYALSHTTVAVGGGTRVVVAMKNIQGVMEKTEVDSWHKLVRVLTHEIMNSITPIISLSETLSDMATIGNDDGNGTDSESLETMAQGLGVIRRRSQGLLTFVENYRKLTRVAMPVKSEVRVAELFADLKKLYTQSSVTFEIEGDEDVCIYADRGQMEQVLINLLKNAVEASDEGETEVRCSFRKENRKGRDVALITVEDNGRGILPDVLERIFVPFFTTKKNGSGIGLSLCKQIVMNHGGEISVKSEDGVGTTVEILLTSLPPYSSTPHNKYADFEQQPHRECDEEEGESIGCWSDDCRNDE